MAKLPRDIKPQQLIKFLVRLGFQIGRGRGSHVRLNHPGGHIEPGETVLEAITWEAEEETGLQLQFVDVIAWGELIGSKDFRRPAHFIYFDVYCKKLNETELKLDNQELTDFKWLLPEEALLLDLAESYPETIQKFIDYKNG